MVHERSSVPRVPGEGLKLGAQLGFLLAPSLGIPAVSRRHAPALLPPAWWHSVRLLSDAPLLDLSTLWSLLRTDSAAVVLDK